ncbi:hypothetical protein [Mumia zhuanghuii]|nr:hypothetical protein [Mumia zhuanghuii]
MELCLPDQLGLACGRPMAFKSARLHLADVEQDAHVALCMTGEFH